MNSDTLFVAKVIASWCPAKRLVDRDNPHRGPHNSTFGEREIDLNEFSDHVLCTKVCSDQNIYLQNLGNNEATLNFNIIFQFQYFFLNSTTYNSVEFNYTKKQSLHKALSQKKLTVKRRISTICKHKTKN